MNQYDSDFLKIYFLKMYIQRGGGENRNPNTFTKMCAWGEFPKCKLTQFYFFKFIYLKIG